MKRNLVLFVMAAALMLLSSVLCHAENIKVDEAGHSLTYLWKEYDKVKDHDLPQKKEKILWEIRNTAREKRLLWDYYDASVKYLNVAGDRNWKRKSALKDSLKTEFHDYGAPVLDFLFEHKLSYAGLDRLFALVQSDAEQLKKSFNPHLYKGCSPFEDFDAVLGNSLKNDYEYALWTLMFDSIMRNETSERVYEALKESVGNKYPQAVVMEYRHIMSTLPTDVRKERLDSLARKYEGRAAGLLPVQKLLSIRLTEMAGKAGSDDYKAFRNEVESYERERMSYKTGEDMLIAKDIREFGKLIETLDSEYAVLRVIDGKAVVAFRNMKDLTMRIIKGRKILENLHVSNPCRSYYKYDTVYVDMPSLGDGDYVLDYLSGKESAGRYTYSRRTLSVASRKGLEGDAFYVADFKTGEPVREAEAVVSYGSIEKSWPVIFDGFTPLPAGALERHYGNSPEKVKFVLKDKNGYIRCTDWLRLSTTGQNDDAARKHAVVMLDRRVFKPGDLVRFKAVAYEYDRKDAAVEKGMPVKVYLYRDKEALDSLFLVTNDFGSVSGVFALNGGKRLGMYNIRVMSDSRNIGSIYFRVDDIVLPSYDVTFEPAKGYSMPGDSIVVKGKLTSFSGHALSSARVYAEVSLGRGKVIMNERVYPAADGRFEVIFPTETAEPYETYNVKVRVVSSSGETLSFSTNRNVSFIYIVKMSVRSDGIDGAVFDEYHGTPVHLVKRQTAEILCRTSYYAGGDAEGIPLEYRLVRDNQIIKRGNVLSGGKVDVDFSTLDPGLYDFDVLTPEHIGIGWDRESRKRIRILNIDGMNEIKAPLSFVAITKEDQSVRLGSGTGKSWFVVEFLDASGRRLKNETVSLEKGEIREISCGSVADYKSDVILGVCCFRNGECYTYSHVWRYKAKAENDMNMSFLSFHDKTLPGQKYTFTLKGNPDSEMLVSVFDISTEKIQRNIWRPVFRTRERATTLYYRFREGMNGERKYMLKALGYMTDEPVILGFEASNGSKIRGYDSKTDEVIPFQLTESKANVRPVDIREDFAATLAFEPFLYPDKNGNVSFDVSISDKLSTFAVSVFSHDKSMYSSVLRKNMLVTMPVKVSVSEPRFLYHGDRYVMKVDVSNSISSCINGAVSLEVYDTADYKQSEPVADLERSVTIQPEGTSSVSFEVDVPDVSFLGFKIVFAGHAGDADVSDGMFVTVPVYPKTKKLSEAHSMLAMPEMNDAEIKARLRSRFVNLDPDGAEYSRTSIYDMLLAALPQPYKSEHKDAVSQSEAMYINLLAASIRKQDAQEEFEEAVRNLLDCCNEDGGISWFPKGKSSLYVTALVLERYAALKDRGLLKLNEGLDKAIAAAVTYMDRSSLAEDMVWYMSPEKYMWIRSNFTDIPLDRSVRKPLAKTVLDNTSGVVINKVCRIRGIRNFLEAERGMDLIRSWGLKAGKARLMKIMAREIASLKEYAVKHPSGGIYYPNAVMPWRGFIESEAYVHSMICDLYRDLGYNDLADGIRLWLMLQKETQKWDRGIGFVNAVASVCDASEKVRNAAVAVLGKTDSVLLSDIRPGGNGAEVSVTYYKRVMSQEKGTFVRKRIKEGDILNVGDVIMAEYKVWSPENRNFMKLEAPRSAFMTPVVQLSSHVRSYSCYREKKSDRTIYWMELMPEEGMIFNEEMYVTQEGEFSAPVMELESLLAPHYRANSGGRQPFTVE